jgi:Na+-translocating ferredoxin:NAD+ oxidoreductase subunit A
LFQTSKAYSFTQSLVYALGAGIGFTLALILMAGIREQLEFAEVPNVVKGTALTFWLPGSYH